MQLHGQLPPDRIEALRPELSGLDNLERVVRWALARDLPLQVVPMDEFTHDVLVSLPDGLVLVFDST